MLALAQFAEVSDQQLLKEIAQLRARHVSRADASRGRTRLAEPGGTSPARVREESAKGQAPASPAASPRAGADSRSKPSRKRSESPGVPASSTPIPSSTTPQPSATPLPSSTSVLDLTPKKGGDRALGALLNAFNASQTKLVEAVQQGMRGSLGLTLRVIPVAWTR